MGDPTIDVYPVGALAELQCLARVISLRRELREQFGDQRLMREHLTCTVYAFRRGWRRKGFWNGYLAEPRSWDGWRRTRCGSGWTRRRALESLMRHAGVWAELGGGWSVVSRPDGGDPA